ncbi:tRNA (adenosine(37)-N6)-threonylcarbamoyltransferase complex dimerization subunit type 1 TsaB [Thiohalobacter sp. IOR34]|uniref:tRNA (adenosine(37)-N6)-threonylcarbamoyltransferase complex dimerization subunit type 1 TsaB n=1 Tax=Thiohalobacter sp. IOR34 TaxID=3057176 RepID=UPI0025B1AA0C|nr:tRNA (adenosine(37)-N6)-threonylcarbamoyltransferase complex dimerization subunit type 1 TsaB [Thiohalobacter sp. IOR34]WJW76540.1 tRNA (adenosine(37)-N6)-threonylcarbamoyltransferase complex dimerization subunit type 1 TsaB [Thiohalobacter sp. IOR34]
MKLLALDTATEACSAALLVDGELRETSRVEPRGHARLLLAMIETLLAEAGLSPGQLDGLAFGRGPGSFTGLRIAAGVAQGIAFAADLPVLPVSTLATLAQGARDAALEGVLAAIDARMQEVYWGVYRSGAEGLVELEGEERVCAPAAVTVPAGGRWRGAGTGWGSYGEALAARCAGLQLVAVEPGALPHARDMLPLAAAALRVGGGLPAEQAQPVYLRNNVADRPRS